VLFLVLRPGNVLLSQDPAVQVPLALEGLTVVFEMGTRGTPPPLLPDQITAVFAPCDALAFINSGIQYRYSCVLAPISRNSGTAYLYFSQIGLLASSCVQIAV
jgi:hypothetical protein